MKALSILLLFVTAAVFGGCDAERETPTAPGTPPATFKSLQDKDDVLWNLELSYNKRDIDQFTKLLDEGFIFFFCEADYSQGDIPVSWERPDEIATTTNLFDPNYPGPNRAASIDLELTFVEDDWTEVPQGDDPSWFSRKIEYNISVLVAAGFYYRGNRLRAQIILREATPKGETGKIWRIIRWRDFGEGTWNSNGPVTNLVSQSTWGGIKAVYR